VIAVEVERDLVRARGEPQTLEDTVEVIDRSRDIAINEDLVVRGVTSRRMAAVSS